MFKNDKKDKITFRLRDRVTRACLIEASIDRAGKTFHECKFEALEIFAKSFDRIDLKKVALTNDYKVK